MVDAYLRDRQQTHAQLPAQQGDRAGISAQGFHLIKKIADWDAVLTPDIQRRVLEAHPEVSFRALAGLAEQPERMAGKKTAEGAVQRMSLLMEKLGFDVTRAKIPTGMSMLALDDLLDAVVLTWTAQRVARFEELGCPRSRTSTNGTCVCRSWCDGDVQRASRTSLWVTGWGVLAALVTADVLTGGPLRARLDPAVEQWVDRHGHGPTHLVAHVLLQAGQRHVLVIPLVVLALLVARRQRRVRPILAGLGTLLVVGAGVWVLKYAIGRTAPASGRDAVLAAGASFPSGHAVNGLVLWTLALTYVAVWVPWLTRRRRLAIATLAGLAAGLGTMGMGYHWASDVLAGWAIGALGCLLVLAVDPAHAVDPTAERPSQEPVACTAERR